MLTVELARNIAPTFLKKDSTPKINELLNTVFSSLTQFPLFEACSIYTRVWFCKMTDNISRMRTDEHRDTVYQLIIKGQIFKIYCQSITEYYGCTIYCNPLAYSTCTEGK